MPRRFACSLRNTFICMTVCTLVILFVIHYFAGITRIEDNYNAFANLPRIEDDFNAVSNLPRNDHNHNAVTNFTKTEDNYNPVTIVTVQKRTKSIVEKLSDVDITCQDPKQPKQDCGPSLKLANRFPKILMIGFGKSGTDALLYFLLSHPAVDGPVKEVNFYNRYYPTKGLQSYLETFPPFKQNVSNMDKSPLYIVTPDAPHRLVSVLEALNIRKDSLKLIVLIREPIARSVSEYLEQQSGRKLNNKYPPFDEMVGHLEEVPVFISRSEYDVHISNWLRYFPIEQFCFLDGHELKSDPFPVMQELEKCLGLSSYFTTDHFVYNSKRSFYCLNTKQGMHCLGEEKGRKHPDISEETREILIKYFQPHNARLNALTGRDYSWTKLV